MFLNRELALLSEKPVWAPNYCMMGDLFQSLTSIQIAEPLECICQLHKVMQEMLGTVGISIIADAEVFISPQTDIQINGFMALGSALIQTGDNRRAGSVCVSGTREQIDFYHEALSRLIRDLPHLLER